jgi:hypothetical protein
MQQIVINKTEYLPFKIVNLAISFLLFLFYSLMYLLSIKGECNIKCNYDELAMLAMIYIVLNFLAQRWIRKIDGIFKVSDIRLELSVKGFSYMIWLIQPINVIYDSKSISNWCLSSNGILMACSMTIMFVCLFGKRDGLVFDVKYNFAETSKSKKRSKRKRRW